MENNYQAPPKAPKLKKRKGFVFPIILLIIGGVGCAWVFGIFIIIIAIIMIASRSKYNRKIEVENAQALAEYNAMQYAMRSTPPDENQNI